MDNDNTNLLRELQSVLGQEIPDWTSNSDQG